MKSLFQTLLIGFASILVTSCVSQKKHSALKLQNEQLQTDLVKCGDKVQDCKDRLTQSKQESDLEKSTSIGSIQQRNQQIDDLKVQLSDAKNLRDKQLDAVGNLTVLSKEANANIDKTLSQLEQKDKYIYLLQAARTKTDSLNLALAINLTSVLKNGIEDKDIEIKVDKTVVMINLSDKMLFSSGSAKISNNANIVLEKIAQIIKSRPELEVMVEGYTDNVAINTECIKDNWDLSAKRATAVVRVMQENFNIDPNKLIAAGRGEYNLLASNNTPEGRMINRRTRIILMPKLNQFYDLLNPDKQVSKK
jgi:chemotaxis protein MotB